MKNILTLEELTKRQWNSFSLEKTDDGEGVVKFDNQEIPVAKTVFKHYMKYIDKLEYKMILDKIAGGENTKLEDKVRDIITSDDNLEKVMHFCSDDNKNVFEPIENTKFITIKDDKNTDLLQTLFQDAIVNHGKDYGKGEVLLATYFKNVYKTPPPSATGGDYGDDYFLIDGDEHKHYIEVKSALPSGFKFHGVDGDDILTNCAKGITHYLFDMKKKDADDLYFVVFDNIISEPTKNNTIRSASKKYHEGCLVIHRQADKEKTTELLKSVMELDDTIETKNNKDNDFTFYVNPDDKKLHILLRK